MLQRKASFKCKKLHRLIPFLTIFVFGFAQENGYLRLTPERPKMPGFPAPSLRIKGLGKDFVGMVSDFETDILSFPSLLPFLKSNQIGINFIPERWSEKATANLTLMLPRTFLSRIGLVLQNQVRFFSPKPEFYSYQEDYYRYYGYYNYVQSYFQSYRFGVYQQFLSLPISLSPSFIFAPFHIYIRSPYENERIGYSKYETDTLNYSQHEWSNRINDDITEHQFGVSFALKLGKNSLQVSASLKNGKNERVNEYETNDYDFRTYDYLSQYDSSYYYHFYQSQDIGLTKGSETKTGKLKEQNFLIRWQDEINGKFNLIAGVRRNSRDLAGQEIDTTDLERWDYYYWRWRTYPNPESTDYDCDTTFENTRRIITTSGKGEDLIINLAGGYQFTLTQSLNSFIGFQSTLSFAKDSIYDIAVKTYLADSTFHSDTIADFILNKTDQVGFTIPIGLEYNITKPFVIRTGIMPKFTYEKYEFSDKQRVYPVSKGITLSLISSFGLGFKINQKLSVDLYNRGELFTLSEWQVQTRYRF